MAFTYLFVDLVAPCKFVASFRHCREKIFELYNRNHICVGVSQDNISFLVLVWLYLQTLMNRRSLLTLRSPKVRFGWFKTPWVWVWRYCFPRWHKRVCIWVSLYSKFREFGLVFHVDPIPSGVVHLRKFGHGLRNGKGSMWLQQFNTLWPNWSHATL